MVVHIYSVKAKSQHKKAKAARYSAGNLKNLPILPKNSAKGLRPSRELGWGYISVYENTPKKLPQI